MLGWNSLENSTRSTGLVNFKIYQRKIIQSTKLYNLHLYSLRACTFNDLQQTGLHFLFGENYADAILNNDYIFPHISA